MQYFLSGETQLKNAKMAAVLLSKLLGTISLLPVREVASRTAVCYKCFCLFFKLSFIKLIV